MMMNNWSGGFLGNGNMWGMWIWPTVIIATIAIVAFFALRANSGSKKKKASK